jgi:hypothetical protein
MEFIDLMNNLHNMLIKKTHSTESIMEVDVHPSSSELQNMWSNLL